MESFEDLLERLPHQIGFLPPLITALRFTDVLAVVLGILTLILSIRYLQSEKVHRLPPGPRGVPFFGYLPFLGRESHKEFEKLCQKYGNVCGLHLGNKYVVILGDYESIKEGMSKEELLGRPHHSLSTELFGLPSVITSNGSEWKEQRRFTIQQLRNVGMGKKDMEGHMQEEITEMIKEICKHDGKPFDLQSLMEASMSNNITALVFGRRLEYNDPQRIKIDSMLRELMNVSDQISTPLFIPKMLRNTLILTGFHEKFQRIRAHIKEFQSVMRESIKKHKEDLDENNPRDFIDHFLNEIKKRKGSLQEIFNEVVLGNNAFTYFLAGSETVKTTLSWFLTHMAAHPDIQEKFYQEIVSVIGKDRMPSWADHLKMPYCEAVIAEVHRITPAVPIGVVRCALEDVEVQGYTIPKDTWVFPNIWTVHHDPKYWKDPENFRPERFLNSEGKFVKSDRVIPFVIGKRSCPGEQFANVEVFLYAVSLIQRFKVLRQEGKQLDLEGSLGGTFQTRSLNIVFVKRNS